MHNPLNRKVRAQLLLTCAGVLGCGGAAVVGSATVSEADWRTWASPRPTPIEGAPRVTVSGIELRGPVAWTTGSRLSKEIALVELTATALLSRRDVEFVDRRRFAVAAEAERAGLPRPPGAPPAGVSRDVYASVTAEWLPIDDRRALLEIRLVDLESGLVRGATRATLPPSAGPVELSRSLVAGTLEVLDDLGELPAWPDRTELAGADVPVSDAAVRTFLAALAAEEMWNWDRAARGYEAAQADPAFYEAGAALARAARLRLGGTLAESQ